MKKKLKRIKHRKLWKINLNLMYFEKFRLQENLKHIYQNFLHFNPLMVQIFKVNR